LAWPKAGSKPLRLTGNGLLYLQVFLHGLFHQKITAGAFYFGLSYVYFTPVPYFETGEKR
jgi:hypothetical protein